VRVRILHIARYGSVRGGAETYVRAACAGLRDAGHEVALAYASDPDDTRQEVHDGFRVDGFSEDALTGALATFRPDIVHVHAPDVAWLAPWVAARAPVLLAVHDHRLNCPAGTKYWAAWDRACTVRPGPWCLGYNVVAHCGSLRANATLTPYRDWKHANEGARPLHLQVFSAHMRGQLAGAGLDEARIGVTHYPVPPADEARRIDVGDARPVIFASGRLNKEKGFFQLIDALGRVRTRAHLVIAGEGHERRALQKRASTSPGPHRITFTGWLESGQVTAWREQAAIVAVPSMWPEPFGIAGIEAMAAGKPVVAFDAGGIREWCEDGATGLLVAAGDERAFARALDRLLADEPARTAMGAAAKQRANERFSLDVHTQALVSLYEGVCASR